MSFIRIAATTFALSALVFACLVIPCAGLAYTFGPSAAVAWLLAIILLAWAVPRANEIAGIKKGD